jgi:pyridoxamine 5'-phosphate oxidase
MSKDEPFSGEIALHERRLKYDRGALDERSVAPDPFAQFALWLAEALANDGIVEGNAMTLATAGAGGRPAARIVLLRGYDARGFVFYTNYESRKGRELEAHPQAALLFYWGALERQIRIEGRVVRISAAESDAYFAGRPRGHRLSAWASRQSDVVDDRPTLEEQMRAAGARFAGTEVPRPSYWGGYRVEPENFEFWQGRPDRVHDRVAYLRDPGGWRIVRLSP